MTGSVSSKPEREEHEGNEGHEEEQKLQQRIERIKSGSERILPARKAIKRSGLLERWGLALARNDPF
jgi:hypothetical protein